MYMRRRSQEDYNFNLPHQLVGQSSLNETLQQSLSARLLNSSSSFRRRTSNCLPIWLDWVSVDTI
jgi:hypothetical protein